jgi:hypothetical protein
MSTSYEAPHYAVFRHHESRYFLYCCSVHYILKKVLALWTWYFLMVLKAAEKKYVQNSCYGLDIMKNSHSKESICSFMYGVVQSLFIKIWWFYRTIQLQRPLKETHRNWQDLNGDWETTGRRVANSQKTIRCRLKWGNANIHIKAPPPRVVDLKRANPSLVTQG